MHAKTLQEIIREYNSHNEEILDSATDIFISEVRNELERMYRDQKWPMMIGVSELGIYITELSEDFKTVKIEISPFISGRNGKSYNDEYPNDPTFTEYLENKEYLGDELYNFQGEEILALKPYCDSLKRKGFGCYVDTDYKELIVTLKIY